ncbi:MAG: transporter substrate-binding domain-containing protein [Erysipelotrichaceae bacterium]|nr:transporter substrate-binding domain-containing protein [Erysipelotrichaceae bacterium]
MKKLFTLVLSLLMMLSLAACGSSNESVADLDYVKEKGKLLVGITDFEPMDYKDSKGNWVGFDADMAKAFAKKLGVEVEFVEIDWDNKTLDLDAKNIDCVWNGMTLTDEVKSSMATSNPYCNNAQTVVVKAKDADKYGIDADVKTMFKDITFAVESGSAGAAACADFGFTYKEVKDQASALMEVESGTSDAAVIDLLMAAAMIGEGTSYADLTDVANLNNEEYGVGFRKGSDLVDELNTFFAETYKDGTMLKIAKKYGVQASLIEQ